ncbi:Dyp-type peroxidase [Marinobacterium jannaschii]|uniref:Dyp-type peroxidase n=1 Tax=Marinobacterium jannaschii TaxID=64970 RepID=UPI000487CB75|nr:Dyp-type peroxidase [Marinobacterium jannaschii]
MTLYQHGVVAEASSDALFLTLNRTAQVDADSRIRQLLSRIPQIQAQYRNEYPQAALSLVVAIGSSYWDSLIAEDRPAQLRAFPAMESGGFVAPDTPADLLFHIRSERHDLNFELGRALLAELQGAAELVEEVHGFRYLDSRDLTGFVDGTENPEGDHRAEVAVIGNEDSAFAGGSYIHLQRYVHDLPHWSLQSLTTQEDTIGRSKAENVEYASDKKAPTAHTKRTSLKDAEGRSIEILRHSMPYGMMKECGLIFASYCRSADNFRLMLESMIEGDKQGHRDHLLRYTRAVTGQSFFAPSTEFLCQLG